MKLAKRTYSLPPDLLRKFERRLAPGERSAFVGRLIGEWLAEREREEIRRKVVEGCREMAELYTEVDEEWRGSSDEVWRANK